MREIRFQRAAHEVSGLGNGCLVRSVVESLSWEIRLLRAQLFRTTRVRAAHVSFHRFRRSYGLEARRGRWA